MKSEPRPKPPECLLPICQQGEYSRGLCRRHYNIANRLVREKATTWAGLEARGKCKAGRTGQSRDNFMVAKKWFLDGEKGSA